MNPGSPTYPGRKHQAGTLGTVGMLEIDQGVVNVQLVDLETGKAGTPGQA